MTRYVPIKSMKPIIAGRPNALSKMSLLEFISLIIVYVKKYNINIKNCKVLAEILYILVFMYLLCYKYVHIIIFILKQAFVDWKFINVLQNLIF